MHDPNTVAPTPDQLMAKPALSFEEFWLHLLGLATETGNRSLRALAWELRQKQRKKNKRPGSSRPFE